MTDVIVVMKAKFFQLNLLERVMGISSKSGGIGKKTDSIKLTKPSKYLEFAALKKLRNL